MAKGEKDEGVVYHAGFPNAAEDMVGGSLSLDKLIVQHPASTFYWRLGYDVPEKGWSRGSIVVVDRALSLRSGDVAVVVTDDEFLLVVYRKSGFVALDGESLSGQEVFWGIVTYVVQGVRDESLRAD